ncbi:GNAT family N-acetyltransferase [Arthrobacter sp. ES1]|uniref:GNAT family N-acetyltransferase n=1 Tax=Arthrobacter sp. ES1 TaxID=1897056 RepID=UPI001CFFF749|nr:GNAT family N-acetyltransferase [Arthrobacter sp. ES1]MCB5280359.1 hypothetical protein [Arthrobacter sp. ES1]
MPSLDPDNLTFEYGCVYNGIPGPEHDPEDYPMLWTVRVTAYLRSDERGDDNSDEVHVGAAMFYIVPDVEEIDLLDTLDAVSQELYNVAHMLTEERADLLPSVHPDLLYLQSVQVKPEFRGHGVGHTILQAILATVGRGVGRVVLMPAPILRDEEGKWIEGAPEEDTAEHLRIQESLKRYWMDFGFIEATPTYLYLDATEKRDSPR